MRRFPIKPATLALLESVYGKLTYNKPKPPPPIKPTPAPIVIWYTSEASMPYEVWCETFNPKDRT